MRTTKEQTAYILQKKKDLDIRRAKARLNLVRYSAAAACLILVAGAMVWLPGLIGGTKPQATSSATPSPASTFDGSAASMIAMLSVSDKIYHYLGNGFPLKDFGPVAIEAGKEIGRVEIRLSEQKNPDVSQVKIFSTFLEVGAKVYEWKGYSPEYRVCAVGDDGRLIGFERRGSYDRTPKNVLASQPIRNTFDFRGKVAEILICDNNPNEIGRINDHQVIEKLMRELSEQAAFVDKSSGGKGFKGEVLYRLYLRLADNSVTELLIGSQDEYGLWVDDITLPDGFVSEIKRYFLAVPSMESLNYGNLFAEIDYYLPVDVDDKHVHSDYGMESVWVDGTTGALFMGNWKMGQWQIAGDARGYVRIEGQDIYYLTLAGNIARIRFEYYGDQGSLYDLARSGADMTRYVTKREILDDGGFVQLQVRLGDIWALDRNGALTCNGKLVASGVRTFALNASGVTYSDGRAIWLKRYSGDPVKIVACDAQAIAVTGVNIYYAPAAGGIWKVRADGTGNKQLLDVDAAKIVFREDTLAVLERKTGKVCLVYEDKYVFDACSGAADMDLGLGQRLIVVDRETGRSKNLWFSIEREGSEYKLYLR